MTHNKFFLGRPPQSIIDFIRKQECDGETKLTLTDGSTVAVDTSDGILTQDKILEVVSDVTTIQKASLSKLITTIGTNAFNGCSNLEYIWLPSTADIGNAVFLNCTKLTTMETDNNDYVKDGVKYVVLEDCAGAVINRFQCQKLGYNGALAFPKATIVNAKSSSSSYSYPFASSNVTHLYLPEVRTFENQDKSSSQWGADSFREANNLRYAYIPNMTMFGGLTFRFVQSRKTRNLVIDVRGREDVMTPIKVATSSSSSTGYVDPFAVKGTGCVQTIYVIVDDIAYDAWTAADYWKDNHTADIHKASEFNTAWIADSAQPILLNQ